MKAENLQRFIESNWTVFVQRRLSFQVVNNKTDKVIGVALNIELEEESYLEMEELEAFEPVFEFQRFMEENFAYALIISSYLICQLKKLLYFSENILIGVMHI